MTETTTTTTDADLVYEDRGEYLKAVAAPDYAASGRYRAQVAEKLQRSMEAGTIQSMGQYTAHADTIWQRNVVHEQTPEALYGTHNPMPSADPVWAEAAKVGTGFFADPEAIARAMAAPHYSRDPSYQQAVRAKIERSINERWITTDLAARDPKDRFTR
ncbi:MAG TPA: hypothetical protein VHW05_13445 [Phenylobacterium sp.]|jgi:hypothetical protein|nr:hypothetical protein [Phenylobacterium sp.]